MSLQPMARPEYLLQSQQCGREFVTHEHPSKQTIELSNVPLEMPPPPSEVRRMASQLVHDVFPHFPGCGAPIPESGRE